MNTREMASGLLQEAGYRLEGLRRSQEKGQWSYTVRLAQECVELALKATLRFYGIEPPKWHDVGTLLMENQDRFPLNLRERLAEIKDISARLRKEREASMYGDEVMGLPPSRLYNEAEAKQAAQWAEFIYGLAAQTIAGQETGKAS
ncbi:MAG: HEPN domain-containing protein [Dehalococcoidia bacterium]|nr:HEPN domain-containing protein [Dehalococcoidia bacterium]